MLREVATLDEVMTGIKRRLETIEGLRASATEPEQPNFPGAYPRLVDGTTYTDFDGDAEWQVDIWVLVGLDAGLTRAQTQLSAYLSTSGRRSIASVLEADPSLNGSVAYSWVQTIGTPQRLDIGGLPCIGASIRVRVFP